jgi:hypothetical protein
MLLTAGADIDDENVFQCTPLSCAAEKGRDYTVRLLLQRGAAVDSVDSSGSRPLHQAAHMGNDGFIIALLDGGADIDAGDGRGATALHLAAVTGRESTVQLLLKCGASVGLPTRRGATPLHWAAQMGRSRVITALLNAGADLEARNEPGCTALHLAAAHGHVDTVKLLLDNLADVHAVDNDGKTAVQVASGDDVTVLLTDWANRGTVSSALGLLSLQTDHSFALHSARSITKARKWIHEAQVHIRSGTKTAANSRRRIKVAVIDTGADLDNQDISPHERRIKFLRGTAEDNRDYDGHGTLVVQLLLILARNIDVYVHKVAESREGLDLSESLIKDLAKVSSVKPGAPDLKTYLTLPLTGHYGCCP